MTLTMDSTTAAPDYAAFLQQQLATQPHNVMAHVLGNEQIWIKRAGAPHGMGRYRAMAVLATLLRLDALRPVPNPGGPAAIATEVQRLRDLAVSQSGQLANQLETLADPAMRRLIAGQIARSVLGVNDVVLEPIDTTVGSAGSTSASRQTWMSGGAVHGACTLVRDRLFARVAEAHGVAADGLAIDGADVVDTLGSLRLPVTEASAGLIIEETFEHHHKPTEDLDDNGQGNCHTAFAFVAHRAVVDVDVELGLVKVVQIATAQDVGRALNPLSVVGQIEGGIAQGLGLAVMEEIIQTEGRVRNASFTDYLLPTFLDMPDVVISLIEEADPIAPLGAKGVGEPPTISSTPAVVAAIRDALGKDLHRVPVRPSDICL